jgi:nucleotide-binding universal stress UspA family protein
MPGIIVGVDGSDESGQALGWAMREAALRHVPLTGLPEMLGTRECQIAVLSWGNGYGWPAGPCYYARL